jgi:hypothetical protein
MFPQSLFIGISTLLAAISPFFYISAILKGKAKPHRTTRIVILTITVLSTASLFAQHNTVAIWLSGVSMLQAIAIFLFSMKYGMGGWAKLDIVCLILALFGIVLWKVTQNPVIALYMSVLADFVGMVPALEKTYRLPHTEVWSFFLMDTMAGLMSLLAVQKWTVQEYSYPLYIMLINFAMVLLIVRPKKAIL